MQEAPDLDELARLGGEIYERLRPTLEPEHNGEAVAIHVDSGDYALGRTLTAAGRALSERHRDGRVYALFIGPPTDREFLLASRLRGEAKR